MEIQLFAITGINYILKYTKMQNGYFKLYYFAIFLFLLYF